MHCLWYDYFFLTLKLLQLSNTRIPRHSYERFQLLCLFKIPGSHQVAKYFQPLTLALLRTLWNCVSVYLLVQAFHTRFVITRYQYLHKYLLSFYCNTINTSDKQVRLHIEFTVRNVKVKASYWIEVVRKMTRFINCSPRLK